MSNKNDKEIKLWNEFILALKTFDEDKMMGFLSDLIGLVQRNKEIFKEVADIDFLDFIIHMDAQSYIIGTSGDDFKGLCDAYSSEKTMSISLIWSTLSSLIWDLTTFTTGEICPQCRADNLRLLTNGTYNKVYKECETCFFVSENDVAINRPVELFPATKYQINNLQ